jgi:hypothetical protein
MDRTCTQVIELEVAASNSFERDIEQLTDLQLASVGGGIADPILA